MRLLKGVRGLVARLRAVSVRAPPAAFAKLSPAPPVPVIVPPTGKVTVSPANEESIGAVVAPVTIAPGVPGGLTLVHDHE